ncbi:MAG TPA: DUF2846 domain-containing protein [Chthoniobacterales bacterium]|jgi:hypothetical protein|nr:DUF2846 domain-containing protein [Chthoniobacterales bacterium]
MNRLRLRGAGQKKPDIKNRRRHIIYYYGLAMMILLGRLKPLTLLTLILVAACSTVQTGQQPSSISAANVATVYLYRTHDSPGGAVGVDIKDNGIDLGTLQDGTYFIYHANPGQHVFTATTDTASTQNMKLQSGATYYVQARVVRSQDLFQPTLVVVFDLQGRAAVQNLKRLYYQE